MWDQEADQENGKHVWSKVIGSWNILGVISPTVFLRAPEAKAVESCIGDSLAFTGDVGPKAKVLSQGDHQEEGEEEEESDSVVEPGHPPLHTHCCAPHYCTHQPAGKVSS